MTTEQRLPKKIGKVLLWVAAITAILTLITKCNDVIEIGKNIFYGEEKVEEIEEAISIRFDEEYQITEENRDKFKTVESKNIFEFDENSESQTQNEFKDYFFSENKEFFSILEGTDKKTIAFVAPAGAGKSFFVRELKKIFPDKEIVKIKMNKIANRENLNTSLFHFKTDLNNNIHGKEILTSELPMINGNVTFSIEKLLEMAGKTLSESGEESILIDDMDEMHPDFISEIIQAIKVFKQKPEYSEVQFFLFGRPEGFKKYFQKKSFDCDFYEMLPGKYLTKGDLKLVINDYNKHFNPDVHFDSTLNALTKMLRDYDFMPYTAGNLSLSNFSIQEASKMENFSENEIKERLLIDILRRNHGSHGRPLKENNLYFSILQQIAKKYYSQIDENGYFEVKANETINLTYTLNGESTKMSFDVQEVLDRSGIIFMNPVSFISPYYKFDPIWIHDYLAKEN